MKKEYLLHFFPFLKKEFRTLDKKEITSEETFKELFPEEKHFDSYKLKAIYEFQNCKRIDYSKVPVENIITDWSEVSPPPKIKSHEFVVEPKKIKKNGKV